MLPTRPSSVTGRYGPQTPETALVVTATVPDPPDTGKRVVLRGLLRYLVDRLGPGNVHYALVGGAASSCVPFPVVVHHLERPGAAAQLAAVASCLTKRNYTLQEAMLGSRSLERQVHTLVAKLQPQIEVYDTLRMGQHAPSPRSSRRRMLYVDDLFSVRYARMLEVAMRGPVDMDPLGGFADNVPAMMRSLARRPSVYLPLLRFERGRLQRREAEIVRGFDVSLLVNAEEVELLRGRSGVSTIESLTPLLPDVDAPTRVQADPPELVFLGNLGLPHNDDAICTFLRGTMRSVARRCPGVRLRIIGRHAGPTLRSLVDQHGGCVVLEGFVEDLDAVFARASAVIAPLRFGSGVKIKVLEGLARGVPLVATTAAAEGIPLQPDGTDGCVIEDDLNAWPDVLAGMMEPARNAQLSAAALSFFDGSYSADVVTAQYDGLFELTPETRIKGRETSAQHGERRSPRPTG
jgi:hypothetical protein